MYDHNHVKSCIVTYLHVEFVVRDWSLITGRGGLQNGRGGARQVLPLRKGGGGGKSFRHAEGGAQKVLG